MSKTRTENETSYLVVVYTVYVSELFTNSRREDPMRYLGTLVVHFIDPMTSYSLTYDRVYSGATGCVDSSWSIHSLQ